MFFVEYIVDFYDEIEGQQLQVKGLTCGDSMRECFGRLVDYYGDEPISEIKMKYVEDSEGGVWENGK